MGLYSGELLYQLQQTSPHRALGIPTVPLVRPRNIVITSSEVKVFRLMSGSSKVAVLCTWVIHASTPTLASVLYLQHNGTLEN